VLDGEYFILGIFKSKILEFLMEGNGKSGIPLLKLGERRPSKAALRISSLM
jgi:hypothetical protein